MSIRSHRSPISSPTDFSRRGFQPLPNNHNDTMDIPLDSMPRRSQSSHGGARRPGEGTDLPPDLSQSTTMNSEKKSFFKHKKGVAGRRKDPKAVQPLRRGTDGEEVSVNTIGRFYKKVVNFSIITRYFVYILPVSLILVIPTIIFALPDNRNKYLGKTRMIAWLFFLWLNIIWLSLWVSKLFAKVVPSIFMALCGVVSSGTRKYALVLKALEIELSLVGWAVTSLVTFTALSTDAINNRPSGTKAHWQDVLRNLLVPALFASILLLVEKAVVQFISINYHRRSFDQRIKESKHSIHLLGLLYDASRTLFPTYCPEFREEDYIINDSIEAVLIKKGHRKSGSATPLRVLGDIGRVGDKVTSLFGNIASEITGKQVFNPTSAHSIVVEALEKTRSSEALAKRLWMSFVVEGRDSLFEDDLAEVLGPSRHEEAEEAFHSLDGDGNGDISLEEMILKVVEIGRDRKSIAASMHDVGQAIGVLDSILVIVLSIIIIFIFVAFQNANFVTTLATAGTTLLSLSFVFAATTQEFLGSCIFLFVKHPFDVGDRVDIVGPNVEHLVVEQISLLYTLFKRIDTMKMVQVPNIVLNNLWVENVTRSKAMKEQLELAISFDTSLEDIEILRSEMETFVRHPDNARDFQPDFTLEASGVGNMDKLMLKIEIRHKSNWHNETVRAARRSKFMCALVLALRKVPIYGPGGGGEALGGPTNPGYSVAITDALAAEARDKAKEAKEAKRLVPTAPKADQIDHDKEAAENLNSRNPLDDAAHGNDGSWTSGRDDQTLGETAEDRKRDSDIDELREGLMKRKSTRGRRRAGDHIPIVDTESQPNISVTSPRNFTSSFGNRDMLDEEAELGIHQTSSTGPLDPYTNQAQTYGPGAGYSVYPQQSQGAYPKQYQQGQQANTLHPMVSAPAAIGAQQQQMQMQQMQQTQQMQQPQGMSSMAPPPGRPVIPGTGNNNAAGGGS